MIRKVSANKPSFRTVEFKPGFNLVLADAADEEASKKTRNSLGKTTLLEIIHFCLAGSADKRSCPLKKPTLVDEGWEFTLELVVEAGVVVLTRSLARSNQVVVRGVELPVELEPVPDASGGQVVSPSSLASWLGEQLFGLPPVKENPFAPNFRNLISYFGRREFSNKLTPFEFFSGQKSWDRQVHSAFLLGMNWQAAAELQVLTERRKLLGDVKKGIKEGILRGPLDSLGTLESRRVRLDQEVEALAGQLADFKVHPQYREVEQEATALTGVLQRLKREGYRLRNTLRHYEDTLQGEAAPPDESVLALYESAGVELPKLVIRRIEEVEAFHRRVVTNRVEFLKVECDRLRAKIESNEAEQARVDAVRSKAIAILDSHGALDEYNRLHERLSTLRAERDGLVDTIRRQREIEHGETEIRVERQQVVLAAQLDHEERDPIREKAIRFFNDNSRALYEDKASGSLSIEFKRNGFTFDVDIEGAGGTGIESMKVFCFDLMLAQLWAERAPNPGFLFHDSRLFDGVDERQKAAALKLAAEQAGKRGFQYICTFNTDDLPSGTYLGDFELDRYVRLRLTDEGPQGSLLGRRF